MMTGTRAVLMASFFWVFIMGGAVAQSLVAIASDNEGAVRESLREFYLSIFETSRIRQVHIDLLVPPEAFQFFMINGKPVSEHCDGLGQRLDQARRIGLNFSTDDNNSHSALIVLDATDAARGWFDVACIYHDAREHLRIRGAFTAMAMHPAVQMFDLRLTAIRP